MLNQAFKNVDDILRTEQGMVSELDYSQQTPSVLFLEYLDDLEADCADIAELKDRDNERIRTGKYWWSSWVAPKKNGMFGHDMAMTGEDLIEFVN